jgi:hypothetical protein
MTISESFVQQVTLLVLGALITGFGVPYVLRLIDARKMREQKKLEAELARQAKLLDAQSALLDEITRLVWAWRYLSKQVVYYGSRGDNDRYMAAKAKYEDGVWGLLDGLRTQISKARRLVSEAAFERLNDLYGYVVHDVDLKVSDLAGRAELDRAACSVLAQRFSAEVSGRLDDAIFELACELRLTSQSMRV